MEISYLQSVPNTRIPNPKRLPHISIVLLILHEMFDTHVEYTVTSESEVIAKYGEEFDLEMTVENLPNSD